MVGFSFDLFIVIVIVVVVALVVVVILVVVIVACLLLLLLCDWMENMFGEGRWFSAMRGVKAVLYFVMIDGEDEVSLWCLGIGCGVRLMVIVS